MREGGGEGGNASGGPSLYTFSLAPSGRKFLELPANMATRLERKHEVTGREHPAVARSVDVALATSDCATAREHSPTNVPSSGRSTSTRSLGEIGNDVRGREEWGTRQATACCYGMLLTSRGV